MSEPNTMTQTLRARLDQSRDQARSIRRQMIALQEELDWRCYLLYGLLTAPLETDDPPEIDLGERASEIVLARRMARGEVETAWFSRHGATPITQLPERWPEDYRRLVERRIALIESDRNIGLIERPEYKRRWSWTPWPEQERAALADWLLDRIESHFAGRDGRPPLAPQITTTARLAQRLHDDGDFMAVAAVYRGRVDFDLPALVAELVEAESVPVLPVLRYQESGLRKRAQWEETWALQRREDALDAQVEAEFRATRNLTDALDETTAKALAEAQRQHKQTEIGAIPVPPKYRSADFLKPTYWRLRGGLDVPKERFVSCPGWARDSDQTLPILWAGWNPLQQAMAIATYYLEVQERDAWSPERLTPLLTAIQTLLPWIEQWHNDLDPDSGQRMGDYLRDFVAEEARALGLTLEAVRAWRPVETARVRRRRG